MREDMPKKILEPSSGRRGKFPRHSKKYLPDEEGNTLIPTHSMTKVHSVASVCLKYTGTDFSVMRRFLMSCRGRLWDQVYSEICDNADYRSHNGHSLRQWIEMLVEHNCQMIDEQVCDKHGIKISSWNGDNFFIHPETKTLEFSEHHSYRKKNKQQTVFKIDDVLYHNHEGIWYRVKFAPLPEHKLFTDVFLENPLRQTLSAKYGLGENGVRYCCWKQQANHKEVQKLKRIMA
jgi:hypothetical protein